MFGINVCRPAVNMCRLEIRMFLETVGTWTASTGSSRGKRLCNLKSYRFLRHIINAVGNCSWVLATQTLRALPFLGGNDGICMGPKKIKTHWQLLEKLKDLKICMSSEKALEITPEEVFTGTTPQQNLNGEPASSSIPPLPCSSHTPNPVSGCRKASLIRQELPQGCAGAFSQAGRICGVSIVSRIKTISLKFGWCC